MSAPTESDKPQPVAGPESPTTARPLEMDDDDVQEAGGLGDDGAPKSATPAGPAASATDGEGPPPPKPPRPVSEQQKNEMMLKEAFPTVELSVIKAVLRASSGRVEPAFNALLEMSDPDAVQTEAQREQPPPQPPRPAPGTHQISQLEADELYARQLAEHYNNAGAYEQRTSNRGQAGPHQPRQQPYARPGEDDLYDREHSFIDDDLPVIRENLRKGFLETQSKVNTWFTNMKKKFDEQFDEEDDEHHQGGQSSFVGRRPGPAGRRSQDYDRYDADPELLSDDFAGMKFNSDGRPAGSQRTASNPNLFKPPPPSTSPKPSDGRKVAFKEGVEDIDAYDVSPRLPPKDGPAAGGAAKPSKWQPLSAVEPSPIQDNDPFSLGDSEDEKDAKDKSSTKEIKMEDDLERMKREAAEAMADSLVDENKQKAESAAKK